MQWYLNNYPLGNPQINYLVKSSKTSVGNFQKSTKVLQMSGAKGQLPKLWQRFVIFKFQFRFEVNFGSILGSIFWVNFLVNFWGKIFIDLCRQLSKVHWCLETTTKIMTKVCDFSASCSISGSISGSIPRAILGAIL